MISFLIKFIGRLFLSIIGSFLGFSVTLKVLLVLAETQIKPSSSLSVMVIFFAGIAIGNAFIHALYDAHEDTI